ncbi:hypothetical protein AAHA92_30093 [Salvia divinorum]|uniref:Uncharacterized protein n=1 Tax=Salvia divinorum TaxID=28513 RepID=A0ABD1G0H0_SALDI
MVEVETEVEEAEAEREAEEAETEVVEAGMEVEAVEKAAVEAMEVEGATGAAMVAADRRCLSLEIEPFAFLIFFLSQICRHFLRSLGGVAAVVVLASHLTSSPSSLNFSPSRLFQFETNLFLPDLIAERKRPTTSLLLAATQRRCLFASAFGAAALSFSGEDSPSPSPSLLLAAAVSTAYGQALRRPGRSSFRQQLSGG